MITNVVGVTYLNDDGTSRASIIRSMSIDDEIILERDPYNLYDSNAVKVCVKRNGKYQQIGFLERGLASEVSPKMRRGIKYDVSILSCGISSISHQPYCTLEYKECKSDDNIDPIIEMKDLILSNNAVELNEGEKYTIAITSGNGYYSVECDNSESVSSELIDNGVVIYGNKSNPTIVTITVTDNKSGQKAFILVHISSFNDRFLSADEIRYIRNVIGNDFRKRFEDRLIWKEVWCSFSHWFPDWDRYKWLDTPIGGDNGEVLDRRSVKMRNLSKKVYFSVILNMCLSSNLSNSEIKTCHFSLVEIHHIKRVIKEDFRMFFGERMWWKQAVNDPDYYALSLTFFRNNRPIIKENTNTKEYVRINTLSDYDYIRVLYDILLNGDNKTFTSSFSQPIYPYPKAESAFVDFILADNAIDVSAGDDYVIQIISGNGSYSVEIGDKEFLSVRITGNNIIISGYKEGSTSFTVTDIKNNKTKSILVHVINKETIGKPKGLKAIDLGLPSGTRWANMNIGATRPEEYGGYFAWGETKEKNVYSLDLYTFSIKEKSETSQYQCHGSGVAENDVANVKWNDNWLMPTIIQIRELLDNCSSEWTELNGVKGRRFTGPNGNNIFLPAAGFRQNSDIYSLESSGRYCSQYDLKTRRFDFFYHEHDHSILDDYTSGLYFNSSAVSVDIMEHFRGHTVRPVILFKKLTLSICNIVLEEGSDYKIQIVSGNEIYSIECDYSENASAEIIGNDVIIHGKKTGNSKFVVSDTRSEQKEIINVFIVSSKDRFLSAEDIHYIKRIVGDDLRRLFGERTIWKECYKSDNSQYSNFVKYDWACQPKTQLPNNTYYLVDDVKGKLLHKDSVKLGHLSSEVFFSIILTMSLSSNNENENSNFISEEIHCIRRVVKEDLRLLFGERLWWKRSHDKAYDYKLSKCLFQGKVTKPKDYFNTSECVRINTLSDYDYIRVLYDILLNGDNNSFPPIITFSGTRNYQTTDYISPIIIKKATGTPEKLEAVDLGLPSGTRWANMNVGATSPEEYGNYYAWGETKEKNVYNLDLYTFSIKDISDNFHCQNYGIGGTKNDVAQVEWNDNWVMPSSKQIRELLDTCISEWTELNGVKGRRFTGPNGNSIFLPAAGFCHNSDVYGLEYTGRYCSQKPKLTRVWNRSQLANSNQYYGHHSQYQNLFNDHAFGLNFNLEDSFVDYLDSYRGHTVRPVSLYVRFALSIYNIVVEVESDYKVQIISGNGTYSVDSDLSVNASAKIIENNVIIHGKRKGYSTFTVSDTKSGQRAIINAYIAVYNDTISGINAIDLGLPSGTKWADMNIGACSPEEYGCLYAWGEMDEKHIYDWEHYKYGTKNNEGNYKVHNLASCISGTKNDIAHIKLCGKWHIPTKNQIKELIDNCSYEWTTLNEVDGFKFTGPNGNSIFMPAAGYRHDSNTFKVSKYGHYWSGTLYPYTQNGAYYLFLNHNSVSADSNNFNFCYYGQSVRPVWSDLFVEYLTLSINEIVVEIGNNYTIQITSGNGIYSVVSQMSAIASVVLKDSNVIIHGLSRGFTTVIVTDVYSGQSTTINVHVGKELKTNI